MHLPLAGLLAVRFDDLRGSAAGHEPPGGSRLYVHYGRADYGRSKLLPFAIYRIVLAGVVYLVWF